MNMTLEFENEPYFITWKGTPECNITHRELKSHTTLSYGTMSSLILTNYLFFKRDIPPPRFYG